MTDEIFFDGVRYLSAGDAARVSNLTRDYIARLCREGKIRSRRVGKNWYADHSSLQSFLVAQEYTKNKWQEELARARALEYKSALEIPIAPKQSAPKPAPAVQDSLSYSGQLAMHKPGIVSAAEQKVRSVGSIASASAPIHVAHNIITRALHVPSGLSDAAVRVIPHTASSALSPAVEFLHKAAAAVIALALTFGTYSFIDPHYAQSVARSAEGMYSYIASGGIYDLAVSTKSQLSAAASDPGSSLKAVKNYFWKLSESFAKKIDNFIYAIAFPDSLTAPARGAVEVNIDPYKPQLVNSQIVQNNTSASTTPRTIIVNNQPVIERIVETQRVLAVGGITEDILNEKINQLDNKLSSQMFSLSAANSTAVSQTYHVVSQTNRIDNLSSVAISSPTITGGTITDSNISGGTISGTTFLGTTTLQALVVSGTGTTTFAGGLSLSGGCLVVNGSCVGGSGSGDVGSGTAGQFAYFASDGTTVAATSSIFVASTTGNIGIGTTSPYSKLSVWGVNTTSGVRAFEVVNSASTTSFAVDNAGNATIAGTLSGGTSTLTNLIVSNTSTSTIAGGLSSLYLNVTGTSATSTFARGIDIAGGCFSINGSCLGSGAVTSVSNADGTLTISPTTGAVVASLNLANANSWTALQQFSRASTTLFSSYGPAYFGATATSSFDAAGALTLSTALATSSGGTGISSYSVGDILAVNGSGILARLGIGGTGQVIKVAGGVPTWGADSTESGGASLFATTSDSLVIYPSTVSSVLVLGASATTTTGNIFEVLGNSLFRGSVTAYTSVSAPFFTATSTTAKSTFPYASSTALTVSGTGYFGTASTTNLTVSALTANRVPYITTAGAFTDSANLTFDGTTLTAANLTSSGNVSLGNATTTNLFSTTASSTNLFSQTATLGTLAGGDGTFSGTLGVTGAATLSSTLSAGTSTLTNLIVSNTSTSTIAGGLSSLYLNVTGTAATSTFARGIDLAGGCFSVNGTCVVTSATGANPTGTIGLTAVNGTASTFMRSDAAPALSQAIIPTWTGLHQFTGGASSTILSVFNNAYFGATATSSFSSAGVLTLATDLAVTEGGTGASTLTGLLQGNGTSALTGITGTAGQFPYYNGTNTLLATSSIYLATSGNVGIGTTSPTSALTVKGGGVHIYGDTSIPTGYDALGLGYDPSTNIAQIIALKQGSVWRDLNIDGRNVLLQTLSGGNVGIGTTTPSRLLTLSAASAPQLALTDASLTSNQWTLRSISNSLYFATSTYSATSSVAALAFNGTTGAATFGSPATSTFTGGVQSTYLNVTGTAATSTFARGIDLAGGCFSVNGTCVVTSATGANPTGTIGLTAVNGTASTFMRSDAAPALSQAIIPTWTGLHQFTGGASSTILSVFNNAYFGATATSSFSSTGALTLATALAATSGGTGQSTVTTGDLLYGSGTNTWGKLGIGTGGFVLGSVNGAPGWVATTTLSTISGTLANTQGGTGQDSSAWSGLAVVDSGTWSASSTLAVYRGGTGAGTLTGLLQGNGTSALTGITGTAGQFPYYNGTNTLLATSSIYLATSGNVGIGTTTPQANLQVTSTGASGPRLRIANGHATSNNSNIDFYGGGGHVAWVGPDIAGSGGTDLNIGTLLASGDIRLYTGAQTEQVRIDSTGKVGIGTTTPSRILTLASASAPQLSLVDTTNTSNEWTLRSISNSLYFATSTYGATSSVAALAFNGTTGAATFGSPATSTFTGGVQSTYLNVTGTAATSTFARGIDLAGGCFSVSGSCVGSGSTSFANPTGTIGLTAVNGSATTAMRSDAAPALSQAIAPTWTALHQFTGGASSTILSVFNNAYFGATATSSFSSTGALTLAGITNSLLSANASGGVVATTTPTAQYFIATSTSVASTFPYASTTALTASGTGYLGLLAATQTSGTSTIASGQGFTIGATQFVLQQGSGNVGIGTASPGELLDVTNGDVIIQGNTTSASGRRLDITNNQPTTAAYALLAFNTLNVAGQFYADELGTGPLGTAGVYMGAFTNNPVGFFTNNLERMRVASGGNVGIGTTTPYSKLSVWGANTTSGVRAFEVVNSASTTSFAVDNAGNTTIGGTLAAGTSTLTNLIVSNTSTSTIAGGLSSLYLNVTGTAATSTFARGIDLAGGCFSVSGTCVGGSGSGTVGSGTAGQFPYYAGAGTTLTATSSLFVATSGNVGIGTTTPTAKLDVQGVDSSTGTGIRNVVFGSSDDPGLLLTIRGVQDWLLAVDNSDADKFKIGTNYVAGDGTVLTLDTAGNVGIGTSSPNRLLTLSAASAPQLSLTDASLTADQWTLRSISNSLYFATSTYSATSSVAALAFNGTTGAATFGSPATTTFTGGVQSAYLNITGTAATSTFARGIDLAGGCFSVNGTCVVTSATGANPTGTIGLTAVNGTASTFMRSDAAPALSQAIAPTWTALHQFTGGASSTILSVFNNAYFGATATSSFSSTGALTLAGITNSLLSANASGVVGATTTPTAQYFIATSTSVASTFPYASTTALTASGTGYLGLLAATQTSGTSTIAAGQGFTIGTSQFVLQQGSGNVGIGTTTPTNLLDIYSTTKSALSFSGASAGQWTVGYDITNGRFAIASSTALGTQDRFVILGGSGNVGIGTTSPYAKLSVVGPVVAEYFHATSTSATSTFSGGLVGNGLTQLDNLEIGAINFDTNAGVVSWVDMPITSAAATGTIQSYSAALDGTDLLTVYGESDGSGGVQNTRIGIGTTTPSRTLTINATTSPQLSLTDLTSSKEWTFRAISNSLYFATSTYSATSTVAALAFNGSTGAATFGSPATTTFTGGAQSTYLNVTGTAATSTFARGIDLAGGCFSISGTCVGTGSTSFANPTGTIGLTAVNGSATTAMRSDAAPALSQSIAPTWTALHQFTGGASSTILSVFNNAYFGATATSSFSSTGALTLAGITNSILSGNASGGVVATTTPTAQYFIATSTSVASTFPYASSTAVTVSGNTYLTGLTSALLGTDSTGKVVATSSVGVNYITGVLPIAQGGTNATSQTTNGVTYYDGTRVTSGSQLYFNGTQFAVGTTTAFWNMTVASSTGPQLALTDTTNTSNAWTLRSTGNTFYVATSTATATSTVAALAFNGSTGAATFGSPATTTFTGGAQSAYLNVTGTAATSTFARGIDLAGGCFSISGSCVGAAAASTLDSLTDVVVTAGAYGDLLMHDGSNWVDTATSSLFSTSAQFSKWLSDETGTGNVVFSASPTLTGTLTASSILATASSTIGGGTQTTGLTISGGATTTGILVVQGSATSTFTNGIESTYLNITGTAATSTFARGIDLAGGCFAINGTCVGGGGSGTVSSGTAGYLPYYETTGTTLTATSTLFLASNGRLGIGTTTPNNLLDIYSTTKAALSFSGASAGQWTIGYDISNGRFAIASSTALGTTDRFVITSAGNVGIGTTSPYATLSVVGPVVAEYFHATSTAATSTFEGGFVATGLSQFDNAEFGALTFDTNAGVVSWVTLPVTSAASAGTPESFSAIIGTSSILTVYAESGGSGYTQNMKVQTVLMGTQNTVALCHATNGLNATPDTIVDCSGAPSDIAEWYDTEGDVEMGDIVMPGEERLEFEYAGGIGTVTDQFDDQYEEAPLAGTTTSISVLKKADNSTAVVGVVSQAPYQTFGEDVQKYAKHPERIALAGRVPVKVTTENGIIKAGDRIILSSIPGVGMKATSSSMTIGVALGDFDGGESVTINDKEYQQGKVLVHVNLAYASMGVTSVADLADALAEEETIEKGSTTERFLKNLFARITKWFADAGNGIGEVFAKTFRAQEEICVDDQCLNKDDVRALIQLARNGGQAAAAAGSGGSASAPTPQPEPAPEPAPDTEAPEEEPEPAPEPSEPTPEPEADIEPSAPAESTEPEPGASEPPVDEPAAPAETVADAPVVEEVAVPPAEETADI